MQKVEDDQIKIYHLNILIFSGITLDLLGMSLNVNILYSIMVYENSYFFRK